MYGLGTIINTAAIVIGGILGLLFGKLISERHRDTLCKACGISVLFIGIAGALEIAFANEGEGMWIDASYAPVVKDAMINGEKYNVYTKLYDGVLTPDAETPISMKTVALSSSVDYQNGKYCVVDTVTQQVTYIDWTPQNSKLDVIVTAHAIQVDGFDSYGDDALQKAYEAYQGQWGSNNLLSVNADETVVDENNAALEEPTTPGQMNPAPADDQTEIPADKPADVNQENVTIPGEGN